MTIKTFISQLVPSDGPSALDYILPRSFSISMCGPYPLRQHIKPENSPSGGELCLSFDNLSVSPVELESIKPGVKGNTVEVRLKASTLRGNYQFFYLESPEVDMDVGGGMGALPIRPNADEENPTPTEKKYYRLVSAETERAKLNQTANGRLLVDRFNIHNDAYHDVFEANEQLRIYWRKDGTSEAMGDHTSEALKSDAVVNPKDRTFGDKNMSYNANAFQQQLNLWAACLRDFPDAAEAALQFGDEISSSTGNEETATSEMVASRVYETINTTSARMIAAGPSKGVLELQAALINIVANKNTIQSDIDTCASRGYVIDAVTCERLRSIYQASIRNKDPKQRVELRRDSFEVALEPSVLRYQLKEQPDGAVTLDITSSTLSVDDFELGMSMWGAEIEAADTRFIRGLLIDRISSQLTRYLRQVSRQQE